MRKGGSAERFETTLRGEPRHRWVPAPFAGAQRASGVGGTLPPRLSPSGGNGKGGVQASVPPGSSNWRGTPTAGTPLVECALALLPIFPPDSDNQNYMSIRSIRFPEVLPAPPTPYRASIRTLNGPRWARCKLGSDLKPRSITTVTDLGCWVLPSTVRSLKDRVSERSHPNKAVDVFAYQSF